MLVCPAAAALFVLLEFACSLRSRSRRSTSRYRNEMLRSGLIAIGRKWQQCWRESNLEAEAAPLAHGGARLPPPHVPHQPGQVPLVAHGRPAQGHPGHHSWALQGRSSICVQLVYLAPDLACCKHCLSHRKVSHQPGQDPLVAHA